MIGSGSRGCFSSLLHDHRRFEFAFEHLPFEFRGRRGSNLSKFSSVTGAFLWRREFRSRLKNNSAGLARAGSVLVDFTATAHLDRSIDRDARIFAFPLSLFFFLFRRTNGNDGYIYFPFVHRFGRRVSSDFVCSTILDESQMRVRWIWPENPSRDDFVSFFSFFCPSFLKQACDICMIFVHLVNLYGDVVSPPVFFIFS